MANRQSHSLDPRTRRRVLLCLLFGWPVVGVIGIALNRLTHSHAPLSVLPVLWLLVLAFVIERMHLEPDA